MAKVPSNKITSGDIQDLAVAVEQLTEETRLLRMSLDELRDDVVWAARQVLAAGDTAMPGYLAGRQCDPFVPNSDLADLQDVACENNLAARTKHTEPTSEPPAIVSERRQGDLF